MTHAELVARAVKWLSGTMRCNPVYAGLASCGEIPDAIGWTSKYSHYGSIVVECKTSRADFVADKRKYFIWKYPESRTEAKYGIRYSVNRLTEKEAGDRGMVKAELSRMGNRRYFMCEPMVLTVPMLALNLSDHGLLWVEGRRVRIISDAPERERDKVNLESEIHYLRMAICNLHESLAPPSQYALMKDEIKRREQHNRKVHKAEKEAEKAVAKMAATIIAPYYPEA
jgi:hypothetical protein